MISRLHTRVLLAALLGAVIVVLAGCSGDSGAVVYQNVSERTSWGMDAKVAFASFGGNGRLYIYSINETGGGLVLLTASDNDADFNDEGGRHPAYSPDASRIAISSRRGLTPAIYLIDPDRGDRDRITPVTSDAGTGADTEPSWAPSGDRIVYTSTRGDNEADLFIINADGSGMMALIDTPASEHWGVISPDGTTLAYSSDAAGNTDIWVKDISNLGDPGYDPTDPGTNLTAASAFRDEAPAWSPDGTKIAFHSNRNGDFDIFMMNADGSNQVAVTADQRSDGFPVFNPAGDRLAITRDREIWLIPALPWADWRADAENLSDQLTRRF